jgi:hypothetical protein
MRRTLFSAAVLVVLAGALALAQGKPDFSGTWTLDVEKSEMGGGPGGGGPDGRGAGGRGPGRPIDAKVVIKQTPAELSLDQQVNGNSNVMTIKLDGSESVNTGMRGGQVKSRARWDGAKLIVQTAQTMRTPDGERTIETTETRSLAPDGSMIVERTSDTPRGTRTQKLVFKKAT